MPAPRRAPTCRPPPDPTFPTPFARATSSRPPPPRRARSTRSHGALAAPSLAVAVARALASSPLPCALSANAESTPKRGPRREHARAPLHARRPSGCAYSANAECASSPVGERCPSPPLTRLEHAPRAARSREYLVYRGDPSPIAAAITDAACAPRAPVRETSQANARRGAHEMQCRHRRSDDDNTPS
ncbi:uncharacterized protein SCHCODRAFT_02638882 [Schizophyllum commune H4-8]|nr:uncharacterized protein SCHCODRAFT_02638882 [Schizophyllum commune H4-8]KAI5887751.1 hypothetical protein SCHCODRAFT_02638882 [Schizophyllum commune H4-8]